MILALPALLVCAPQAAPQLKHDAHERYPAHVAMEQDTVHVPFELQASRPIPVVEATVNGQGPFQFYFDTGAGLCVLDSTFAKELGLEVVGKRPIGDPTRSAKIDADDVRIGQLELAGIVFETVPAATMDRTRFGALQGVKGVLGLPLAKQHLLTLDYARQRLTFEKSSLPAQGEGIVSYDKEGLPQVPLKVCGETHYTTIDCGAPGGFTLAASVVAKLPLASEPVVVGRGRTVNSEFEVKRATLDGTIELAGHEFVDPDITYNDLFPHGNIGYSVLKDFRISLDQKNKRMRFVRGDEIATADAGSPRMVRRQAAPGAKRSLGVMLRPSGKLLEVTGVTPGSVAERAGFQAGDRLVAVNGRAVSLEDTSAMTEALQGTDAIKLTVERTGKEVELTVPAVEAPKQQ